jgi:hypothetical protein
MDEDALAGRLRFRSMETNQIRMADSGSSPNKVSEIGPPGRLRNGESEVGSPGAIRVIVRRMSRETFRCRIALVLFLF